MRIVSPLLSNVVYPLLSRSGMLQRHSAAQPAVVTYHGVLPAGYRPQSIALDGHLVSANMLRQHLRFLKSHYNVISPEEFRAWIKGEMKLPPGSVLLTCDDGLVNVVTDMLPILREFELPCLFFVTGGKALDLPSMLWHEQVYLWLHRSAKECALQMPNGKEIVVPRGNSQRQRVWRELITTFSELRSDGRNAVLDDLRIQLGIGADWANEYSQKEGERRRFLLLQRHELRALLDGGGSVGTHTLSHPLLSRLTRPFAEQEIAESRARVEQAIGEGVWAMAYPFGNAEAVSARDLALAENAGYDCAFMNIEYAGETNVFAFPRIHVSLGMSVAELDAHVSGFYQRIRGLRRREQLALASPKHEIEFQDSVCA